MLDLPAYGRNLKAAREARGLTQKQAGDELGLTERQLSRYESGRAMPSLELALRLCSIYAVALTDAIKGANK